MPYAYCEQIGKEIRDISDEIPFEIPDSWERKMETQRARVEEAEAAMAQVDPTNYTALGEQQAKIDEAHAAMDELEMAWLEASEKLEGEE